LQALLISACAIFAELPLIGGKVRYYCRKQKTFQPIFVFLKNNESSNALYLTENQVVIIILLKGSLLPFKR